MSHERRNWPAVTIAEAYRILTEPGAPFEMETIDVCGRPTRVYKNAHRDLRAIFDASRAWNDRTFIVYGDERVSYRAHYRAASALAWRLVEDYGVQTMYELLPDRAPPDRNIHPDDDATILYTSGTTGRPKGALGTHRNIMCNLVNITFASARAAIRRGDPLPAPAATQKALLLPVPFFHVTGCHSAMIPAVANGSKIVLMHKWNAEMALELIEREHVTGLSTVPSMAWQLIESPDFKKRDLTSLEGLSYGGAAASPDLARKIAALFPGKFASQGYGATAVSY